VTVVGGLASRGTDKPSYDKPPPLVGLNLVQSKVAYLRFTVNIVTETDRSTVQDVFHVFTLRRIKVMVHCSRAY